jgi:hypothetical protein
MGKNTGDGKWAMEDSFFSQKGEKLRTVYESEGDSLSDVFLNCFSQFLVICEDKTARLPI